MNKLYVPLIVLALSAGSAAAQNKALTVTDVPVHMRLAPRIDLPELQGGNRGGGGPLWSDDFADPGTWVTANTPGTPNVPWQIGLDLQCTGDFPIASIQSTTSANGYALVDSDAGNNNTGNPESATLTTANPINLSDYPNVVIEFESFYRKWTNEECYLVISTNNTDWPALNPSSDISGLPNVFRVWPDMEVQAPVANPTKVRINISAAAGGQDQVWVRFHWTGVWGYAWFVDDVAIIEQPANDMVMTSGYLSQTGEGEEYGRIPRSQLAPTMLVGGDFLNFGYEAQTNVAVSMDLLDPNSNVVVSASTNQAFMASGQASTMEQVVTLPALDEGVYTGVFTVVSDEEQDGPNFANNTYLRTMEVIDTRYSLDGIGLHPAGYEALGSLGTNTFADASDGFMMFVFYEVRQALWVTGLEIAITASSVEGALLYGAIHTEDNVLNDMVNQAVDETVGYDLTAADVSAGSVTLMFDMPVNLQPGRYYAGVEMYSNGNATDVRILNDQTVPQPSQASMIYIPGDQVYTNGNAAAIRLMTDPTVSVPELEALVGVSLFPNPSNGLIYLHSTQADNYLVEVSDLQGRLVHSTRISGNGSLDLSNKAQGAYHVRVSTEKAAMVQRIALH